MFFPIATIIKPHGVKGELKVLSLKSVFSDFLAIQKQFQIEEKTWKVSFIKEYKQGFILKLMGIDDMDSAEELRGQELMVKTKNMLEFLKQEGHFFTEQWLGYSIEDENKNHLGIVEEILYTGANDVLVVVGKQEILVPVVPDFIIATDDDKRLITVVKPEYDK